MSPMRCCSRDDVGLLEVEEPSQILHRAQGQRAGIRDLCRLSKDELALPFQREAVAIERRQAVFELRSLVVELHPGIMQDRYRDRLVADQVPVEVELILESESGRDRRRERSCG